MALLELITELVWFNPSVSSISLFSVGNSHKQIQWLYVGPTISVSSFRNEVMRTKPKTTFYRTESLSTCNFEARVLKVFPMGV